MFLARKKDGKATQVYRLADDVTIPDKMDRNKLIKGGHFKCTYGKHLIEGWRWPPKRLDGESKRVSWTPAGDAALCGSGWSAVAKTPEIARFKVEVLARGEA